MLVTCFTATSAVRISLDFTVVGPAVNEASRIAGLCRSLKRDDPCGRGDNAGCAGAPGQTYTRARGTIDEPTSVPAPSSPYPSFIQRGSRTAGWKTYTKLREG